MKIALIIEHFDASRGGAEQFTVWLAGELRRAGHEVHIVCHDVAARSSRFRQATHRASHDIQRARAARPIEPEPAFEGLHIHKLRGFRLSTGLGFRLFGRRAAKWCREHRPDVAHSMTVACPGDLYQPHAGVYAEIQAQAVASRRSSGAAAWKRLMLRLSGKQRTLRALEARAARPHAHGGPARILSLCPMITRQFAAHYGVDGRSGGQIFELPNPQMKPPAAAAASQTEDRAWFRGHYHLAPEDRVAVFVGHDFRRKGLRYAIEAMAKTQNWKLLVVGLGKAREYVELADRLGVGDTAAGKRRVLFVGPTREMDKVYAASDALILPTFYDPYALVVLEALSHGLPVISTESLGNAYLVIDHHAGTIVPSPRDTDLMAQVLEALPAPGTSAHQGLVKNARAAGGHTLPEKYLQTLLALYQQVHREKQSLSRG